MTKKDLFLLVTVDPLIHLSNFNRIAKKSAVDTDINKYISSHIFRHTHISLLSELGIPLKAIMERVGHRKPEVTLSIYTHVTNEMKNKVVEKLNEVEI